MSNQAANRERISDLFELARGPHLRSVGFFTATFITGLITHFTTATDVATDRPLARVAAVFLAQLVLVALLSGAETLNRRLGFPISARGFAVVFVLAGAIRGAAIEALLQLLQVHETAGYFFRIYVGATNFGVQAFCFAVVFGLAAEFSRQTRNLEAQEQYFGSLQTTLGQQVATNTQVELNAFREYLLTNLKLSTNTDPEAVHRRLQSMIDEIIRPLVEQMVQHRTAISADEPQALATARPQRVELRRVLERASVSGSIHPLIQAALPFLSSSATVVISVGWQKGLILMFGITLLWPALLLLAKKTVAPRLDQLGTGGRLASVVGIFTVTISPVAALCLAVEPNSRGMLLTLMAFFYANLIGVSASVLTAYQSELNRIWELRNQYLQQIRWKVAEVNSRAWHQQLHFARRVHGKLQSEVAAQAIRLDRRFGAARPDPAEIERISNELESRVRQVFEAPEEVTDLNAVLAEIVETWQGISAVSVNLDAGDAKRILADQIAVETTLEIIREGVSNAIRHGHAREVEICVSVVDSNIVRVQVTNDGSLVPTTTGSVRTLEAPPQQFGTGSQHLQDCTVAWSISPQADHTVLLADIPLRS